MSLRMAWLALVLIGAGAHAQENFSTEKDLRERWAVGKDGGVVPADEKLRGVNTVYIRIDRQEFPGASLYLESSRRYFLFVNGKVVDSFSGAQRFSLDSLYTRHPAATLTLAVHQKRINPRDLVTRVVRASAAEPREKEELLARPYAYFRDFVVIAGMVVILFFVVISRLNPKLAADYFSPTRVVSQRDTDDSQASARLTSGANVQFYVLCSLLVGFYLMLVFYKLPDTYLVPGRFQATSFWSLTGQWLKLSGIVFVLLMLKIALVFGFTRLFDMRGMARIHYFNFIRVLLLVFGFLSVILFFYYIARGDSPFVFTVFLALMIGALGVWLVLAFFKLSGRSGHSVFHLFSYLCTTEIIPLLVTAKVLFQ